MIAMYTKGIGVKKRLLLISAVMVLSACDAQKRRSLYAGNGEFFQ
jgi:hypothetical protein